MRVEEDLVLRKMRKKSKKSKKNANVDFERAATDTDIDGGVDKVVGMKGYVEADCDLQTENDKKLKKRKFKSTNRMNKNGDLQGAASGTDDVRRDEVVGMNEYVEADGDLQTGKGQRLKKRKSESKSKSKNGDLQEVAGDTVMTEVNVSANTTEEYKKRNNKHDEADQKGSLEVDGDVEKEKEHRKKKKKLNFPSDKAASNEKPHMGEKILQIDDELDAGNDSELKSRKEKKKKKNKKKRKINFPSDEAASNELDVGNDSELKPRKEKKMKMKRKQEQSKKVKDVTESSSIGHGSEGPQPKRKLKKVSFSSDVEVFPSVVRGKRFSRKEDEIVKEAVLKYIKVHCLGEDGLDMVMHCKSHPEIRNCWKEIGAAIPYRPATAIYYRAHILFERGEKRQWTEEEYEFLQEAQQQIGNDWKSIAEELGKHRFHVKDTWRRIKLKNRKKGHWSQEEYQNLYDLVNLDLQMKLDCEEKKSKHGMLRDNIPWGAISDNLSTRSDANCCSKWYTQLTSSMVAEGIWADADDYRLVGALYDLDACCEGDVDWDNLLKHRSGDVCRKRWNQMVLHIGHHGCKPFAEQVETLAMRYCPHLAEAREDWDSKPVTD